MRYEVLNVLVEYLKALLLAPLLCMVLKAAYPPEAVSFAFKATSGLFFAHFILASCQRPDLIRDITHRKQACTWVDAERNRQVSRYVGVTLVFLLTILTAELSPGAKAISFPSVIVAGGVLAIFSEVLNVIRALWEMTEKARFISSLPKRVPVAEDEAK